MNAVTEAGHRLAFALSTIPDVRVSIGAGRVVTPPAVVIGPPQLTWAGYNSAGLPRTAQWSLFVVAMMNEFAVDTLLELIPQITAAIETHSEAVVTMAKPGIYPSPGGNLPSYQVTVQMDL